MNRTKEGAYITLYNLLYTTAPPLLFYSLIEFNLICWLRQSYIKTPAFFEISWTVPVGWAPLSSKYRIAGTFK